MVQILPQFDPGAEVGKSIGTGLSDALKLLGQRELATSALDRLSNLDVTDMSPAQIYAEVGKATAGLPHMQKQASDMAQFLVQQRKAQDLSDSYRAGYPSKQQAQTSAEARPEKVIERGEMIEQVDSPEAAMVRGKFPETPGMREPPLLQEQTGEGPILSQQEAAAITEPLIASGQYDKIPEALNQASQNKLKQRQLQLDETQALREEQQYKRKMAEQEFVKVRESLSNLRQSKGLPAEGDEEMMRLMYKYYQDERANPANRDATDEQLLGAAQRTMERKVEDEVQGFNKHLRPTWRLDKKRRAEGARDWVQNHLKAYGNNPEQRAYMKSLLMNAGWSREEATAIVQPFSKPLQQSFNAVPKPPKRPLAMTPNQEAIQGPRRELELDRWMEKAVPKLREGFKPYDSLYLLKSRLVRDMGLTDDEAIRVINQMREPYQDKEGETKQLPLRQHQIADLSLLPENTRPSLYDVMFGDRTIEIMGPLIK